MMKKLQVGWTVLGTVLMIGCAASTPKDTTTPSAQAPAASPEPRATATGADLFTSAADFVKPAVAPALEPPVAIKPPGERAAADVLILDGSSVSGTVSFEQDGAQVSIVANLSGLPPGLHGFTIHEKNDCGGKQAKNVGAHFNPGKSRHGPPSASKRHLGDFGNVLVDAQGNTTLVMTTDSLTVFEGVDSVVGRSIVIHAKKDDGETQPGGNSGPAIACGVITARPALMTSQ